MMRRTTVNNRYRAALRQIGARNRARQRGGMIIGVLFFLMIISFLLMGTGTMTVGHQNLADTDAKYTNALNVAEAGVNYEFRKLSQNPASADQYPGSSYTFNNGTYKVYCQNTDGTTPWTTTSGFLEVVSTGTVDGVSRTVKVSAKGFQPSGRYAIYTVDSISVWSGASALINGDIGTNGKYQFSSTPTINGGIYFNGPNAGWQSGDPGVYTELSSSNPITWPTIDQIANEQFPNGGMTWLATHNNNANANPPIVNNSITDAVTLTAGDYYVTNINLTGSKEIYFDNRNGPVNLWIGPPGGTGTAKFRGGTAYIPIANDPTKANHVYVATRSGIDLGGNAQMDALIYAYNKDPATGVAYGYATNSGNPTINGQIISNQYDLNGNITLNYVTDLIKPISFGYYGYNDSWSEVNQLQR